MVAMASGRAHAGATMPWGWEWGGVSWSGAGGWAARQSPGEEDAAGPAVTMERGSTPALRCCLLPPRGSEQGLCCFESAGMNSCVCMHACVGTYIHVCLCTCMCTGVCMYALVHVCVCAAGLWLRYISHAAAGHHGPVSRPVPRSHRIVLLHPAQRRSPKAVSESSPPQPQSSHSLQPLLRGEVTPWATQPHGTR